MTLEETIQMLVKYRVTAFKGSVDCKMFNDRETVELELHPLAFSAEVPGKDAAFGASAGEEKCNCGHTLTEHSEHGLCLQGCSADACGMEPARNP